MGRKGGGWNGSTRLIKVEGVYLGAVQKIKKMGRLSWKYKPNRGRVHLGGGSRWTENERLGCNGITRLIKEGLCFWGPFKMGRKGEVGMEVQG